MADKTVQILQRLVAANPDDVDTRAHLASLLAEAGHTTDALGHAEEVLRRAPKHADALALAARLAHETAHPSRAAELVTRALEVAPKDGRLHILAARIHLKLDQPAVAEDHYFRAIGIDNLLADPALLAQIEGPEKAPATIGGTTRRALRVGDDDSAQPQFTADPALHGFAEVGGMEEVKDALRMNIILPLQRPELFRGYGKPAGGGILLYGPPGCGKSYLARATAGECRAKFFSIGLHDILDMYVGNSEKNLHELFRQARESAPSVVFIDEIDALGGKRGAQGMGSTRGVVNTLLMEMDKIRDLEKPILVVGATNTPWSLDTALKRPGRFDRIVFVPPPDEAARKEILAVHLKGKPTETIDTAKIASKTRRFSGADLRAVVDLAIDEALRMAIRSGKSEPLTTKMLLEAASKTKPSTGEWFATARDYAKYSNEGGAYDPVLEYLGRE